MRLEFIFKINRGGFLPLDAIIFIEGAGLDARRVAQYPAPLIASSLGKNCGADKVRGGQAQALAKWCNLQHFIEQFRMVPQTAAHDIPGRFLHQFGMAFGNFQAGRDI